MSLAKVDGSESRQMHLIAFLYSSAKVLLPGESGTGPESAHPLTGPQDVGDRQEAQCHQGGGDAEEGGA